MKRNDSPATGAATIVGDANDERQATMIRPALDIHRTGHARRFLVGRDAQGHWVVRDRLGLVGGIFADEQSAVRFALTESDHVSGAVIYAPSGTTLSLDPLSVAVPVRTGKASD